MRWTLSQYTSRVQYDTTCRNISVQANLKGHPMQCIRARIGGKLTKDAGKCTHCKWYDLAVCFIELYWVLQVHRESETFRQCSNTDLTAAWRELWRSVELTSVFHLVVGRCALALAQSIINVDADVICEATSSGRRKRILQRVVISDCERAALLQWMVAIRSRLTAVGDAAIRISTNWFHNSRWVTSISLHSSQISINCFYAYAYCSRVHCMSDRYISV